jgi:hypothetical protein
MKWLTFEVQKDPGFRLNLIDAVFVAVLCAISAGVYVLLPDESLWLVPLYLGLSFFLFCNVFRIGNRLEAIWYIPFIATAVYSVYTQDLILLWVAVACILEPLKWALILYRVKKGPYVGVMSERFRNCPHGDTDQKRRG